jgi:RinA family phage transcriptional activator
MSVSIRVDYATSRYIERELFFYRESLLKLARMREEILHRSPAPSDNIGASRSSLPSEVTANKAIELVADQRIQHLERITFAIKQVMDRLPPEKLKLVQLKYWARPQTLNWDGVAHELNVSRMTVLRWKREIIFAIFEMAGMQ